ncbi:MAG TPA: hypothetical protein VK425_02780 [Acidimicrobiales bacterium]|nr:hypothetical protein [Acidimicrobiales bacterium]
MRAAILIGLVAGATVTVANMTSSLASAAACSTSTGAASCTVSASVTVSAGTLALESSPNLYWDFVGTGYDQWASGSATALTACAASGSVTHCSSGAAPVLEVVDPTGSNSGWAVSEYLSSNTLPSGAVLHFNGAGSTTTGYSQVSPVGTDPFAGTTPTNVCDFGSTCSTATAATTCSHSALGFTTCPSYPVTMGGTGSSAQVDLYSAAANSGAGAICFATGAATATGCTGTTSSAFYNLGIKGNTAASTYSVTINLAVNSGP